MMVKEILFTGMLVVVFFCGRLTAPKPTTSDLREMCRRGAAPDEDVVIFSPWNTDNLSRFKGRNLKLKLPPADPQSL